MEWNAGSFEMKCILFDRWNVVIVKLKMYDATSNTFQLS